MIRALHVVTANRFQAWCRAAVCALLLLPPALQAGPGNVDRQRMLAAEKDMENWMSYGRTYGDQRYSPLAEINDGNVAGLKLDWYVDIPSRDGLSATPLVVDGVVYMSAPYSIVYAYDAASGKLKWSYDPVISRGGSFSNGWAFRINRGVAVWEGKVFVATADCRLVALDAATGKEVWTAPKQLSADKAERGIALPVQEPSCDPKGENSMDGAPRVANGKVFIGGGVADFGARGVITAYDANTGEEVWRFYTVSGDPAKGYENKAMEMAAKTWNGEWWALGGGGGTVWDAMAHDPDQRPPAATLAAALEQVESQIMMPPAPPGDAV